MKERPVIGSIPIYRLHIYRIYPYHVGVRSDGQVNLIIDDQMHIHDGPINAALEYAEQIINLRISTHFVALDQNF